MSDALFEDFFEEADALASVNTETTKSLSEMVRRLRTTEEEISKVEAYLKQLTDQKHKLSTESIPVLMDEMGVERVDVDGVTVTRKMVVSASIPVRAISTAVSARAQMPATVGPKCNRVRRNNTPVTSSTTG